VGIVLLLRTLPEFAFACGLAEAAALRRENRERSAKALQTRGSATGIT